ncbi:MAG: LacI family DNA-binding transcriptional regulator, partial [Pseudomonadota bacterium]
MMAERITSLDVARRAGVSQSAVSRVFTPGASVSKEMSAKVRAAAEALGYRPNVLARSLITGRSRIVGLVLAYLENQFYPVALEKLSAALQAEGYHILIFLAPNDRAAMDQVMEELLAYQVDGIIAASVAMTGDLASRCADAGIPVVLFNRDQDEADLPAVTSDNRAGGREVARFLLAGGHRRIAHIAGWRGASTGRDREAGFREGLAEGGAAPVAVIDGLYRREVAAEAARTLFAPGGPRPDALFVGNDH